MLAADAALTRLLAAYGIVPDMVMGHSLGEYGALVAAGALPFEDALEAVSARGREMASLTLEDNGAMAAVSAPLAEVERILAGDRRLRRDREHEQHRAVPSSAARRRRSSGRCRGRRRPGYNAVPLPVSHAFHTEIVAPASEPLRRVLARLRLQAARAPDRRERERRVLPDGAGRAQRDDRHPRPRRSPRRCSS